MPFTPNFQLPVSNGEATSAGLATAINAQTLAAYTAAVADAPGTGGGGVTNAGFYDSVASFNTSTIPPAINTVIVANAGEMLGYIRTPGASGPQDLQHPNGSRWAKAMVSRADFVAALADALIAIDRIPYQVGAFGGMTITAVTPGTFSSTYTVQRVEWQRIGNTCEFSFRIAGVPTLGTAAGQLRITGFPFVTAAAMSGGFVLRASQGVDLQYYTGGTPSAPAYVGGFFPDAVQYCTITIGHAAGSAHQFLPINRLTTSTPYRLEGWGQYRLQV